MAENEYLVKKHRVEVVEADSFKDARGIAADLMGFTVPRPNKRLLGLVYFKLKSYYTSSDTSKKINKWIQKRIAEPPALVDSGHIGLALDNMNQFLFNKGYFHSQINYTIEYKRRKKAIIHYQVTSERPTMINKVKYLIDDDAISHYLNTNPKSKLLSGKPYDVDDLLDERRRITDILQNSGFFYFQKQYVLFEIDTLPNSGLLDIYVKVLPPENDSRHRQYTIRNISLYPDYTSIAFNNTLKLDTMVLNDVNVIFHQLKFNPKALLDRLYFKPGDIYTKEKERLTVNRFTSLRVFRFANMNFKSVEEDGRYYLDLDIYLQPAKAMGITLQYNVNTSNQYILGSEIGINYNNRNFFKYTDLFTIGLNTGIEMRSDSGRGLYLNTLDIKGNATFIIPKFLVPFKMKKVPKSFNPKTSIGVVANFYKRLDYYTLNSYKFSYSYDWNEFESKRHILTPFEVTFVALRDTTSAFSEAMRRNPTLRKSFEDQMIVGTRYTLFLNNKINNPRSFFNFRSSYDIAGNTLYLANVILYGKTQGPYGLFGRPFSQYIRTEQEIRYFRISRNLKNSWAFRFIGGAGIPYLNSEVLPYVKQFVIGGSNSIRGYRVREIGPGSYKGPSSAESGEIYNDRTGDIKLEGNIEYRYRISNTLRGAVFLDVGNIWLITEEDSTVGAKFEFNKFYKDLYVGTGAGIRLDFSFFLLRLDIGIPLRDPRIEENGGWRWDQLSGKSYPFFGSTWRRENLLLNLAIGYPF